MPYSQTFTVTCKQLPLDMLRYDRCYPSQSTDVIIMIAHNCNKIADKSFSIDLKRIMLNKNDNLTIGRWNSFGCSISNIHTRKL